MGLKTLLAEITYGKARYNIKFTGIECQRSVFASCCQGTNIDEMERYGMAIHAAKAFKEREWFLTEENILVCGKAPQKLGTPLSVSIVIDRNIFFLMQREEKGMREGVAFRVIIDGVDLAKPEVVEPRDGFRINFLGTPE